MVTEDNIFGELTYDFVWSKETTIEFLGETAEIALIVNGGEDGAFEDGQYAAYQSLIENWDSVQAAAVDAVFEHYIKEWHELGYDVEPNKDYPPIVTREQLLQMITLTGITVPYAELYGGRSIGICFDCSWDAENGVGLRFNDEKVIEVGHQDIAM